MAGRYRTASQREAAKLAGEDVISDGQPDPLAAQLADQGDAPPKKARLKHVGGSEDDAFNLALAEATRATAWIANEDDRAAATKTVGLGLAAVAPRDELEGMLGAQLVAAHMCSLECFRRAMIDGQTVEGRAMNLKHATKASQTFASLLDALNRRRGKGPQQVVVEHVHRHVHVHENTLATDRVEGDGGGACLENQGRPHAQRLSHAPAPLAPVWGQDPERDLVSESCDVERSMSDARGQQPGRTDRNE